MGVLEGVRTQELVDVLNLIESSLQRWFGVVQVDDGGPGTEVSQRLLVQVPDVVLDRLLAVVDVEHTSSRGFCGAARQVEPPDAVYVEL